METDGKLTGYLNCPWSGMFEATVEERDDFINAWESYLVHPQAARRMKKFVSHTGQETIFDLNTVSMTQCDPHSKKPSPPRESVPDYDPM